MLLNDLDLYPLRDAVTRATNLYSSLSNRYNIGGLRSNNSKVIKKAMEDHTLYKISELNNLKGTLSSININVTRSKNSINGIGPARNACKYNQCSLNGEVFYSGSSKRINPSKVDRKLVASIKESINHIQAQVIEAEKRKALNPKFSISIQYNNVLEGFKLIEELANQIIINDFLVEKNAPLILPQFTEPIPVKDITPKKAAIIPNITTATEEKEAYDAKVPLELEVIEEPDNNTLIGGITVFVILGVIGGLIYLKKR